MVYDWENKEEICYRMYIEEKKSLEDIMEYMKEELKFAPRYVDRSTYLAVPIDSKTISSSVLTTTTANVPSRPNSNDGIFLPSRTPPTKMQLSFNASKSYGTAILPRRICFASSTTKVMISRSAS
jgi:hypothetical protein